MKTFLCLLAIPAALMTQTVASVSIATSTFDNNGDGSANSDGWFPWTTETAGGLTPDNPYLNVDADGIGERGKLITFNSDAEWTGDYFSAGVTQIQLDVANFSTADTLHLRVAVGNRASPMQSGGTWWLSTTAVILPESSGWTNVTLSLAESDLVRVGNFMGELGTDSYEATFGNIQNIRLLSGVIVSGAIGDEFIGPVAMDNISLLIPEPSAVMLLLMGSGVFLFRRRQVDRC